MPPAYSAESYWRVMLEINETAKYRATDMLVIASILHSVIEHPAETNERTDVSCRMGRA